MFCAQISACLFLKVHWPSYFSAWNWIFFYENYNNLLQLNFLAHSFYILARKMVKITTFVLYIPITIRKIFSFHQQNFADDTLICMSAHKHQVNHGPEHKFNRKTKTLSLTLLLLLQAEFPQFRDNRFVEIHDFSSY